MKKLFATAITVSALALFGVSSAYALTGADPVGGQGGTVSTDVYGGDYGQFVPMGTQINLGSQTQSRVSQNSQSSSNQTANTGSQISGSNQTTKEGQLIHTNSINNVAVQTKATTITYTPAPQDRLVVNGKSVQTDVPMQIGSNGRLELPVKYLFDALGVKYTWNQALRVVFVQDGNQSMVIKIDSNTLTANGKLIQMDNPATIIGGRTMIPLRSVSEALGADVKWDDSTKTVSVSLQSSNSTTQNKTQSQERTGTDGSAIIKVSGLSVGGK